ncbi:MAG: hypothetical protein JWO03_273 [Bacteroidetes bacterium]|nr:hypothetical protein [Bacteroidota bacterium]
MRKVLFISLCLSGLILTSCDREHNPFFKKGNPFAGLPSAILKDTTTVEIAEKEFHFGKINEGDKVEHTFTVKNTGEKPLIIANAYGSCGCTVPEYPKEPIAPGSTADIKVTFNSTGKKGEQHKSVTMQMNTVRHNEEIFLVGDVTPKDKDDKK